MAKKVSGLREIDVSKIGWLYSHNSRQCAVDSVADKQGTSYGSALADLAADAESVDAEGRLKYTPNKKDGTAEGLVVPLLDGWDAKQGVLEVVTVAEFARLESMRTGQPVTSELIVKQVQRDRETILKVWEQSDAFRPLCETARQLWEEAPEYIAVCGYRRSVGIVGAIHRRRTSGKPLAYPVACEVTVHGSPVELLASNIRENLGKDQGRRLYAPLDYLRQAVLMLAAGGKEADLCRAGVKRGTAQKVWATVCLDRAFPDVGIVDRCRLPEKDPLYLPLQSFDAGQLRKLLDGCDPKQTAKVKIPGGVTGSYVANYFDSLAKDGTTKVKSMSDGDMSTQLTSTPSLFVKTVLVAVLKNDAQFFNTVAKLASTPEWKDAESKLIDKLREAAPHHFE